MEAKLNKVDLEIRQNINKKTEKHKVHKKEENIIREDINEHKNMVQYNNNKRNTIIVEAEQDLEEYGKGISKGLIFDRTT